MAFNLGDLTITRITFEGPEVPNGPLGTAEVYGAGEIVEPPNEIPLSKFANYWRLDADGNDSLDTAHGVLNEVTFQTSELGNAATFTGATTCNIEFPSNVLTSDTYVGVSFLVRTNITTDQRVFSFNDNGTGKPYVMVQIDGTGISGRVHSANPIVSTGHDLLDFTHVFIQATEGGEVKLFVNGFPSGEIAIVNFAEVSTKGNFAGASRTGFSLNLDGQMLGISRYSENVTDGEVLAIATHQLSGQHIF